MSTSPLTPAQRQYQQFKAQHPGYVLFFRTGDFYELFHDDAMTATRVLGVALATRRWPGQPDVLMARVPFHAVEGYLRKMIAAGHRVALCEQVDDKGGRREIHPAGQAERRRRRRGRADDAGAPAGPGEAEAEG